MAAIETREYVLRVVGADAVHTALLQLSKDGKTLDASLDQTSKGARNAAREMGLMARTGQAALRGLSHAAGTATRDLLQLAKRAAEVGAAMAVAGAGIGVGLYAQRDAQIKGLTALMGTADKATRHFAELKAAALLPGTTLTGALDLSVKLQAVGMSAEFATRAVRAVGNALALSAKSPEEMGNVALSLQQIGAQRVLMGEEIREISQAIPQVRAIIGQAFPGKTVEDLQKMGISGKQFLEVLVAGLEDLPKSLGNVQNDLVNMGIAFKELGVEFGRGMVGGPEGAAAMDAMGTAIGRLQPLAYALGQTVAQMLPAFTSWLERLSTPASIEGIIAGLRTFVEWVRLLPVEVTSLAEMFRDRFAAAKQYLAAFAQYGLDVFGVLVRGAAGFAITVGEYLFALPRALAAAAAAMVAPAQAIGRLLGAISDNLNLSLSQPLNIKARLAAAREFEAALKAVPSISTTVGQVWGAFTGTMGSSTSGAAARWEATKAGLSSGLTAAGQRFGASTGAAGDAWQNAAVGHRQRITDAQAEMRSADGARHSILAASLALRDMDAAARGTVSGFHAAAAGMRILAQLAADRRAAHHEAQRLTAEAFAETRQRDTAAAAAAMAVLPQAWGAFRGPAMAASMSSVQRKMTPEEFAKLSPQELQKRRFEETNALEAQMREEWWKQRQQAWDQAKRSIQLAMQKIQDELQPPAESGKAAASGARAQQLNDELKALKRRSDAMDDQQKAESEIWSAGVEKTQRWGQEWLGIMEAAARAADEVRKRYDDVFGQGLTGQFEKWLSLNKEYVQLEYALATMRRSGASAEALAATERKRQEVLGSLSPFGGPGSQVPKSLAGPLADWLAKGKGEPRRIDIQINGSSQQGQRATYQDALTAGIIGNLGASDDRLMAQARMQSEAEVIGQTVYTGMTSFVRVVAGAIKDGIDRAVADAGRAMGRTVTAAA